MINILLHASVTGGIGILLWYLTYPLSRKYFRASWHYAVLKIMMVFMLFPIGIFAPIFNNVFAQPNLHISEQIQKVSIDAETINTVNTAVSDFVFPFVQYSPQLPQTDNVVEQTNSVNNHTDNSSDDIKTTIPNIPYLQIIWLIVAVTLFSNGIRKIHKFKKQILNTSSNSVEDETQGLFLQCRKQLGVRGKISLRTSEHTKTPFVFGFIRPIIIFPETGMNADEKKLALIHELTHIKNGDLWLKFIAFIISAVHWFNPFSHLLSRKISYVSEEYCDERVVKTMTQDERFLYGNLILKVVTDITAPQSKFCSTLSASTKNIKRRLFNMMNLKKSRKSMVALSVITAFILCSFTTIYAFAANDYVPENIILYTPADTLEINLEEDTNESVLIKGRISLAYTGDDGEAVLRVTHDGGATWYIQDENDNLILDPDISATKWLTYDEFRTWIDKQDVTDEKIAEYETMLENFKNFNNGAEEDIIQVGIGMTAIKGVERPFLCTVRRAHSEAESAIDDSEVTIYKSGEPQISVNGVELTPEQVAEHMKNNGVSVKSSMGDDGEVIVYESGVSDFNDVYTQHIVNSDSSGITWSISGYKYFTSCNGDNFGFDADTYKELYKAVEKCFEEQIAAGKMTREEADSKLAEVTEDNTFAYIEGTGDIND